MTDRSLVLRERHVAPSILSADFSRLGAQVSDVLAAGARVIHVDVMDGHFVPPITFGAVVVSALADLVHDAGGILDVHMMVDRPERHVAEIAKAGADGITVHVEATDHLHYTLDEIRSAGCTAGVALCPGTPPASLDAVALDSTDLVLCMSVNPGWGGQAFIPGSLGKLQRLRAALPDRIALEVDGGVNEETAPQVAGAGANLLVTGSAVFGSGDPPGAYTALVSAAGLEMASDHTEVLGLDRLVAKSSAVNGTGALRQEPIDGLLLRSVRPVPHEDGTLAEVARAAWAEIEHPIVQVHLTTTLPGRMRAWGLHRRSTDRLFVISGLVSIVVYDGRVGSPTQGSLNEFKVSERNPVLLVIPPNLYHGWKNIGTAEAFIVNMPSEQYDYESPDALDLPYDSPDAPQIVPFRW